jgi:hypothetical protein
MIYDIYYSEIYFYLFFIEGEVLLGVCEGTLGEGCGVGCVF